MDDATYFDDDDFLNPYLERDREILISGDRLPHWHQDRKYIFYTFRLGDSLPQYRIDELKGLRKAWLELHPQPWSEETKRNFYRILSNKIEKYIDAGFGECILRYPGVATIVEDSLMYNDGILYDMISYVVMPNHVHALIQLLGTTKVEDPVNDWKSFTAHAINRHLHRKGNVWMVKYFDRIIRSEDHYKNVLAYIADNYRHGGVAIGPTPCL